MKNHLPKGLIYLSIGILTLFVIYIGLIVTKFYSGKAPVVRTKAAGPEFVLIPPNPPIVRNTDVIFTATIDTKGQTINQGEIWLSFLDQYMTFVDVTPGLSNDFPNITHTVEGNKINVKGTNEGGFTGIGVFALIKFRIKNVDPPVGGVQLCTFEQPTPTPPEPSPTPTSPPVPTFGESPTPSPTSPPETPTPSPTPTPPETPTPTNTPQPTPTPTEIPPTPTPIPLPTSTPIPPTPIPTQLVIAPTLTPTMPVAGVEKGIGPAAVSILLIISAIVLRILF